MLVNISGRAHREIWHGKNLKDLVWSQAAMLRFVAPLHVPFHLPKSPIAESVSDLMSLELEPSASRIRDELQQVYANENLSL